MTAQQAKGKFDNLKDFKAKFLFWEKHKNLIQRSFTNLQNELNELTGKQDQASNFRRGNIFRELQLIKPLPQTNEEKALVAKYWIDFYQKDLETKEDPIYSFDHYKQVYQNKSRVALNLKDFMATEQKRMNVILDKAIWKTEIKLEHDEVKTIKDFVLDLTNSSTIDYTFIYEYVDEYSYNLDYHILVRLFAPAQYSNFLKDKLDTLQNGKPLSTISDISDNNLPNSDNDYKFIKGFDNAKLNQIMNDDKIELFLKNELRLKADGFITSENKWVNGRGKNQTKTLKDLANLILLLKEEKYFRAKFDRKNLKESDYKNFFEVRYHCNLREQFNEATNNRTNRLETAKIIFHYFKNLPK